MNRSEPRSRRTVGLRPALTRRLLLRAALAGIATMVAGVGRGLVSAEAAATGPVAGEPAAGEQAPGEQAAGEPRMIDLVARRFVYEPNEIAVSAGERVVLRIWSLDFVHGMNIPDLKQRFDLVPGRPTRIPLSPKTAGVIEFVCDNFCGDGHEEMHGRFVVRG